MSSIRRQRLLDAAEELFLSRGFASVSTNDIARLAGCNHALIHYYFGNKEDLFRQLFLAKIEHILTTLLANIAPDKPVLDQVDALIDAYFNFLTENRNLPFFIINELTLNPERRQYLKQHFFDLPITNEVYQKVNDMIQKEVYDGKLRPIQTNDLLLNIMGLTIGSFLVLPTYQHFCEKTPQQIEQYLNNRRQVVKTTIRNSLEK